MLPDIAILQSSIVVSLISVGDNLAFWEYTGGLLEMHFYGGVGKVALGRWVNLL